MSYKKTKILIVFIFISLFICQGEIFASEPQNITASNIGSDRFTISWITDVDENASINYGDTPSLGNTAYDTRGELFSGTTHYIAISGLDFETTYYYDIISGGVTYNNGGAHYTVTTGADLSPAAGSDTAYGEVFLSDGTTPAEDAIVYINLRDNDGSGTTGDSQVCSSLVDNTGYWYFELKNIRSQTLDSYFEYSDDGGDNLALEAYGPNGGVTSQVVDTQNDSPAPDMTLIGNTAPVLDWTDEAGYENDGLEPETGYGTTDFVFRIKYTDSDGDAPSVYELYIDKNGDGDYLDPDEVAGMTATGSGYASGVIYTHTSNIPYSAASQNCSYYFKFSDGFEFATGNITEAITEATAINRPDISQTLGISIDKNNWNTTPAPVLIPAPPQVMSQPDRIRVTNSGDGLQDFSLRIQDEDDKNEWVHSPFEGTSGLNAYVLSAIFCGAGDTPASFNYSEGNSDDVLTNSAELADDAKFAYSAGSENGSSVAPLDDVYLYFRLDLPTAVGGAHFDEEHDITVELSCQGE